MSFITIFLISFGLIFTAELGDKTQLMIFTLALRYGGRPVLAGAMLAFALLSGSAAVIGKGLGELLSPDLITRISAWVFILFGLYMLLRKGSGRGRAGQALGPRGPHRRLPASSPSPRWATRPRSRRCSCP